MPEAYDDSFEECKYDDYALIPLNIGSSAILNTFDTFDTFDHILEKISAYAQNNNIDDINYPYSISQLDDEKATLLELAIESNINTIVEKVLSAGANPNFYHDGMTALFYAVSLNKSVEIISLLLENNADPNIKTDEEYGLTSLDYAIANKNIDVITLLLINGADPNLADNYGKTPLHHIMLHNFEEKKMFAITNILLSDGAKINLQDNMGRTALYYAITQNKPISFIKHLIKKGAGLLIADNLGITPARLFRNNNLEFDNFI